MSRLSKFLVHRKVAICSILVFLQIDFLSFHTPKLSLRPLKAYKFAIKSYFLFTGSVLQSKRPLDRTASAAPLDPHGHHVGAGSNPASNSNSNFIIKQEIVQSTPTLNNTKSVKGNVTGTGTEKYYPIGKDDY